MVHETGDGPEVLDTPFTDTQPLTNFQVIRAVLFYALPIAFVATIVAAFSGTFPPPPAALALATAWFIAFSLFASKQPVSGTIVIVVAIVIFAWLSRSQFELRGVDSTDRVSKRDYGRYLGIEANDEPLSDLKVKNIMIAEGFVARSALVLGTLYHVKSGEVTELNSITIRGSQNLYKGEMWSPLKLTFALGNQRRSGGRFTQLGCIGQKGGDIQESKKINDVEPASTQSVSVKFVSGTRHIVYVEGDEGIHLNPEMSVQSFAKENHGNYLVVELQLN